MSDDFSVAVSDHRSGAVVEVWAVPGAKHSGVVGIHDGAVRIRITAPADRGRANRALADFLAGITGASVELIGGPTARRKRFLVHGVARDAVVGALTEQQR